MLFWGCNVFDYMSLWFNYDIIYDVFHGNAIIYSCYLRSSDIRAAQRKIYFDLKENKRGIFLRISSTASYGAARQTIALPAEGIADIRDCLTDFLDKFGQAEEIVDLPEFQEMRVERKRFYFDCGSNDRGSFLRISEVCSNIFWLFSNKAVKTVHELKCNRR